MRKYQVIYADPPWPYRDKMSGHTFSLDHEYKTMNLEEILNLGNSIKNICEKNCVLFLWATSPNLPMAFKTIDAWGFKYKTVAFVWSKKSKNGKEIANLGRWTMGNVEMVLLATKGSPKRKINNIRQLFTAERKRHSAKPEIVRDKIVNLIGDVPRLELFARTKTCGWDVWGNEVESDIELTASNNSPN